MKKDVYKSLSRLVRLALSHEDGEVRDAGLVISRHLRMYGLADPLSRMRVRARRGRGGGHSRGGARLRALQAQRRPALP